MILKPYIHRRKDTYTLQIKNNHTPLSIIVNTIYEYGPTVEIGWMDRWMDGWMIWLVGGWLNALIG